MEVLGLQGGGGGVREDLFLGEALVRVRDRARDRLGLGSGLELGLGLGLGLELGSNPNPSSPDATPTLNPPQP